LLPQGPKYNSEGRLVDLAREALADHGEARVVRRALAYRVVQERPDGERVGTAGGNGTLAREVLEEADHEHLEVDLRVDARLAALGRVHVVEGLGEASDLITEAALGEHLIELLVERVRRRRRQIARGDPERGCFLGSLLAKHFL